jgi:hypothetical protein
LKQIGSGDFIVSLRESLADPKEPLLSSPNKLSVCGHLDPPHGGIFTNLSDRLNLAIDLLAHNEGLKVGRTIE